MLQYLTLPKAIWFYLTYVTLLFVPPEPMSYSPPESPSSISNSSLFKLFILYGPALLLYTTKVRPFTRVLLRPRSSIRGPGYLLKIRPLP